MLRIADLHAGYGVVPVLNGVDLALAEGEVVGILGRNGSGKSTLMRTIIGLLKPMRGALEFLGRSLIGLPAHRIARLGVAYIPQGRGIFPKLTVEENLRIGARACGGGRRQLPQKVFDYFPVLMERLHQQGGTLSGGEQQMLAIGRALCARPRLLLMDEPSDGVQPSVVKQLALLIPEIAKSAAISVVLVEQNLDLAVASADRCLVMEKGRIAFQGSPDEFKDDAVIKEFLAV